MTTPPLSPSQVLARADAMRLKLSGNFRDQLVEAMYADAEAIARRAVRTEDGPFRDWDQWLDRLVTSPVFGLPIMLLLLAAVFWLTVTGANIPSALIARGLFWIEAQGAQLSTAAGLPWWATGVLWRAVQMAAPAGVAIWLLGNIDAGGQSLAWRIAGFLDPLGLAIGLDGVILLAYIVAIPANEIVVPTMLMVYMNVGMMTEVPEFAALRQLLVAQHGWTMLTVVNLMLFSLLHHPCTTTLLTMWKETRSWRWTAVGALMPLGLAFLVCLTVAMAAGMLGWV